MKLATNVSWQASKWIINILKLSCDSCLNNIYLMKRSIWRFQIWVNGIHKFGMLFMHLETRAHCWLLGCECTFKFYKQAYEKRERLMWYSIGYDLINMYFIGLQNIFSFFGYLSLMCSFYLDITHVIIVH
jgi:hypothetical protein